MTGRRFKVSAFLLCIGAMLLVSASVLLVLVYRSTRKEKASPTGMPTTATITVKLNHPGIKSNAPETYELNQHQSRDGHIVGYSLTVKSVFCQQDICSVVPVTLRWDALGAFESFNLADGVDLEKVWQDKTGDKVEYKAVPFTDQDYQKLQRILSDENSLLKKQKAESLLESRKKARVDAISGATPLALADAVIEGGAITCFHLWHWANGDVKTVAEELTHNTCNQQTLTRYLNSGKDNYIQFALQHFAEHELFNPGAVESVNAVMRDADKEQFELGYAYLKVAIPDNDTFMSNLAVGFSKFSPVARVRLLSQLESEKEISSFALESMAKVLPEMERYYEIHMFLNLLDRHSHESPASLKHVAGLLDNPNFFISRRAYAFLKTRPLKAQLSERLVQFREKSKQDGRILD